jgi:predicted DCC family thiol-disulfide oxidoreductase YuxK
VKALDWRGRLDVAPNRDRPTLRAAGLTAGQANAALWLVLPDGTRYRGAGAAWAALALALPVVGDVGLAVYHLPGVRFLQDRLYDWVAANRGRFARWLPPLDEEE